MKNKSINKIISISTGLIIILILVMNCFIYPNKVKEPLCKNGFIDLSNWDFSRNGNVKLDGYWEFYPNVLLSPDDVNNKLLPQSFYVNTPSRWISQITNNIISDKGIGTYRLRVKTDNKNYMYGLKATSIRSSSKIFVNGREVGKSGNAVASFNEGYSANVVPVVTFFPSEGDTLDIIIQVANLDYYNGGIIQSIYLGSDKNILNSHFKSNILDMMNISFLMLSGIYYFGIYIKRKKDKNFMYFGVACMAYAYISATGNEKIFNNIFTFIPFMLIIKIKTALVCLSIYFISLFIREISKEFIPDNYMKAIVITMIMNMGLILVTPISLIGLFENIIGVLNILIYIVVATLSIRAIIYKRYGSLNRRSAIFLFGVVILIIFQYITSYLYFFSVINSNIVPFITMFMLLIGISAMLSDQYAKAYSELEVMSNNLIVSDKIKDEFLVNTSHEFKTPLHAIMNIAQAILNRSDRNTTKNEENLSYIISIATRLSSLVNDIIDFQSLQNGSLKFNKKTFDINSIVQAVVDILDYMRKGEEIKLINSIPAGKYYVYTDENRFKQIIFNIIGNSLKYTEKGYVEIKADTIDSYVYISVRDTGAGIHKNAQKDLFKRNIYTGETNFTNNTSSGLGLSISKLLASNMGGDLYLKWSDVDKGSIFDIKIPKANEDKNMGIVGQSVEHKSKIIIGQIHKTNQSDTTDDFNVDTDNTEKLKILIVDDEASNIKVLQEILDEEHYETLVAYNGIKALELIENNKDISIVLLDVMMPGLSGYEVCKKIREKYQLFEIPILLLTVRNSPEDIDAGLKAGANDFLVKPFNSKELKARVNTLQEMKFAVKDALKMETIFLQSQIKPHFLYNALSIIISLCYSDGERAGRLLGELSNYLRFTFDMDPYNSFISLKKEISIVKSYVELEKARFGDRLKIELNIDESILDYRIPALIIQPIVENSIRHGLMKRISGGMVKISAEKNNNDFRITIKDDGLGISPEKLENLLNNSFTGSIGLKNVNKRLLNEYGQGLLIDSREGEGTIVTINIPMKLENLEIGGTSHD